MTIALVPTVYVSDANALDAKAPFARYGSAHVITRFLCLSFLLPATLAHPGIIWAQTEQVLPASPPATSSALQTSRVTPSDEEPRGRLGFGSKLGMSLSTFVGDGAASDVTDYTRRPWLTVGGFATFHLNSWFAIQPEVLFLSKGPDVEFDSMVGNTFIANYIEFPLLLRASYRFRKNMTAYLVGGPTLGVLLSFKLKDLEDDSITDRTEQAQSIDLGGLGGLGFEFALSRQHAFMIEGRYNQSFRNIARDDSDELKNSVFALMAGYQFSFSSSTSRPQPWPDESATTENPVGSDAGSRGGASVVLPSQPQDSDGDGVANRIDDCPKEAGLLALSGCPDDDRDADGILDSRDACLGQGGPHVTRLTRGCPDEDNDQVSNDLDYCPSKPGQPSHDGCSLVRREQEELVLNEPLSFQKDGKLQEMPNPKSGVRATDMVDELAVLLQAHPDNHNIRLRITVHAATDNPEAQTRPNAKRKELSQARDNEKKKEQARARANEVRTYLEQKGVSSERLVAEGALAQKQKRQPEFRVEFTIIPAISPE